MTADQKRCWLDRAEVIDSLRIAPRLIMACYLLIVGWLTVYFSVMYFRLPPAERSATLTAFVSIVLTAAYGALPFMTKIYMAGGRAWGPLQAPADDAAPKAAA